MAGRKTNLALLLLLAAALGTGFLAFALGTGWNRWASVAHGAIGLAILILAPWKSVIARRGLRRGRPGSWASVVFTVLVAVALVGGIAHSTGLLRTFAGVTAMQVHVGAALASIPFGVWHVVARRVRPRRTDLSRRMFLRSGALAAGSLAAYGAMAGLIRLMGMPGRRRRFTGSYATGSYRPEGMPVTQWLFDSVPAVDPATWRLLVLDRGSEVGRFSLGELDDRREPVRALIDCTGGWFAEQDWEGVRLDRLLPSVGGARSFAARSVTGYSRRFPAGDLANLWLATRVGGRPLSAGHGLPARIVAPGRRGFWWVKWVSSIEVSDVPWWWQPPFPLQ
ncbi:MAG: molybdopterin-dependent oxidoreductase [Actinomycetota bacterium]